MWLDSLRNPHAVARRDAARPVAVEFRLGSAQTYLRIDGHGLHYGANQSGSGLIVLGHENIAGITVRRWSNPHASRLDRANWPKVAVTVELWDGGYLMLSKTTRAETERGRSTRIRERRLRRLRWRSIRRTDDSAVLRWTPATDPDVAAHLQGRLAAVQAAIAGIPLPDPVRSLGGRWSHRDVRWRRPPAPGEARWLESAALDGTDPPVPLPAPPELPPEPPPLADSALPAYWPDLDFPARYWSLASERAGSVGGKRSSMTFATEGVVFDRRWRGELVVPYDEADRFDLLAEQFNWRLVLFTTDGAYTHLSGLSHGFFKANELFWITGEAALADGGEPTGSMPWHDEDIRLVAARLNAHLRSARVRAQSAALHARRL